MTLRVLVLGATGNFGARIVRALKDDPTIELVGASRRGLEVPGAEAVPVVPLDALGPDLPVRLRELAPGLVIHCIGPFQGQDYRVAEAALTAGAHYLDLADGRAFVVQFAQAMQARALHARRVAISGASTLPALSSAVIEALRERLRTLESVEIAIAPGHRSVRGAATLAAVFSYLGCPGPVWQEGAWVKKFGWMDVRGIQFDIGKRWGAMCDVPDLTLFPARYPELKSVSFHAALEFRLQHIVLWKLAALRRLGLRLPVKQWAMALERVARLFDPFAGPWGGMRVSVVGQNASGARVRRTWQLKVPARDGPEIPTFAAIVLARRIASGERVRPGASTSVGWLRLADFEADFSRWGITTRIENRAVE
jgi:saccharopine dehydrogenase-like NADP-dependent oxidoreductase